MAGDGEKVAAYLFAGFSVFLTLRLALHGSSFCLIRFQIPEHLFSLYVNRIHNAMQLLTLFGSAFGTGLSKVPPGQNNNPGAKEYVSIVVSWSLFLINVVILIAFVTGGKYGHITFFYWSMAISSFIFATNMQFNFSMAGPNVVWYLAAENSTQILTSFLHWFLLLFYGNRRKHYTEFVVIVYQIVISSLVTLVTSALWTAVYAPSASSGSETDQQKAANALRDAAKSIHKLIGTGANCGQVKTAAGRKKPVSGGAGSGLASKAEALATKLGDNALQCQTAKTELGNLTDAADGLNTPSTTSKTTGIQLDSELTTLKEKLNAAADRLDTLSDGTCKTMDHGSDLDTLKEAVDNNGSPPGLKQAAETAYNNYYKDRWYFALSPMFMCFFGLGMVFAFYPAVAPGMLVDFRLVHTIDLVLLLVSPVPSVSIALLSKISQAMDKANKGDGKNDWFKDVNPALNPWDESKSAIYWHGCHVFSVIMVVCIILFIVTLHYPQTFVSKSIYRQSGMTCFVSIMFYMSQEILSAIGYGGVEGNSCKDTKEYLTTFNNFFIRLSMIIFIFFAEGYIVEYNV